MKKLISCEFNMDSGCVELRYASGEMLSIDCTAAERSIDTSMRSRSELDWLIYNAPMEYAKLVLGGDVGAYLKEVSSPYSGIGWNE